MTWREVWGFSLFERLVQLALRATWNQPDLNVRTQTFSDRNCLRINFDYLSPFVWRATGILWDDLLSDFRCNLSRKPKKTAHQLWNPTGFSPYTLRKQIGFPKKLVIVQKFWKCGCACVRFAGMKQHWKHCFLKTMLPFETFETHAWLETLGYLKTSFTFWTIEQYKSLMFRTWLSLFRQENSFFLSFPEALFLKLFDDFNLANTLYHSCDMKIVRSDRIKLKPRLEMLSFISMIQ